MPLETTCISLLGTLYLQAGLQMLTPALSAFLHAADAKSADICTFT